MRLKTLLLFVLAGCTDSQAPAPPPSIEINPSVAERRPSTHSIEQQINAYASSVQELGFIVRGEGPCSVQIGSTTEQLPLEGDAYKGVVPVVRSDSTMSYPRTEEFLNRTAGGSPPRYSVVPVRVDCGGSVADTTLRFVTPPSVRDTTVHLERQTITEVHNLLRGGGLSASVTIEELTNSGIQLGFDSDATTHYLRIGPNEPLTATIQFVYRDGYVDSAGFLRNEIAEVGTVTAYICDRFRDQNARRC